SADEEREEVLRRSVGPLKVFHDHHERMEPGRPLEDAEDQLVKAGLGAMAGVVAVPLGWGRRCQLGEEPRELSTRRPEYPWQLFGRRPANQVGAHVRVRRLSRGLRHLDGGALA